MVCQLSTANLELWAWICEFCSARLVNAETSDRQRNFFHPSAGEWQRTQIVDSEALQTTVHITHCI